MTIAYFSSFVLPQRGQDLINGIVASSGFLQVGTEYVPLTSSMFTLTSSGAVQIQSMNITWGSSQDPIPTSVQIVDNSKFFTIVQGIPVVGFGASTLGFSATEISSSSQLSLSQITLPAL